MHPQNIKAVFFDFDGVIANTDGANRTILTRIFRETLQRELTDEDYIEFFFGKKLVDAVPAYLQKCDKSSFTAQIIKLKKQADPEYIALVEPYLDTMSLILRLKELGIEMFINTGARQAQVEGILQKFKKDGNFGNYEVDDIFPKDHINNAEKYKKGKPDPESYNVLVGQAFELGIAADEIIVIEDSPEGVVAAKAAGLEGLYCIGVTNSVKEDILRKSGADEVVHSLMDVTWIGKEGSEWDIEGE